MESLIYLLLLLVALLIFSGFSSGSETGMMASNKVKLRHNSKKSRGARRALRLLARPDILLSAILVGNNFANILASSVVTIIFIDYFGGKIDAVISDMAVNTTGNKSLDSIVTGELSIDALNFSTDILKKRGCFVSKIFMGPSFNEIVAKAKKNFKNVNVFKPPASRKDSKENFIICKFLR